jgi:hypothetical protein
MSHQGGGRLTLKVELKGKIVSRNDTRGSETLTSHYANLSVRAFKHCSK